jgi:hypothetical protein
VEGGRVVVRGAAEPTPVATAPAPAPTGSSTWAMLGPLLVALAVAVLAVLVLRRRPEG